MHLPPHWRRKLDRFKERFAAALRDKEEAEPRPKLCPACGTLVGAMAKKCHECGTSMSLSMAAVSRSIGDAVPQETPVTYFILIANFMLFTVCLAATGQLTGAFNLFGGIRGDVLYRLGGRVTGPILEGEVWRLVMPIFLHGGLMHIGMNMFVLKDLGPQLEETYGSARYLFLYLVTGVLGFAWTTAWGVLTGNFFGISIGASGSLMGLLGLAIAITTLRGGAYMQMLRGQLLRSFAVIIMLGLIVPGIDNAAHIGGFVSGFLLGRVFTDREPMTSSERKRAYILGWMAGLAIVASLGTTIAKFFLTSPAP